MKTLVLYFPCDSKVTSAFDLISEHIALREMQMLQEIPQEKVDIYMVRNRNNFFGKNIFLPEFQLRGEVWTKYTNSSHVTGDLVYSFNMGKGVTHTRSSKIQAITQNKQLIEDLFPQYTLSSIVCHSYEEICINFSKITTSLKVLKPQSGSRSTGIFIQEDLPTKSEILDIHYPYLLQEFHDTSNGLGLAQLTK